MTATTAGTKRLTRRELIVRSAAGAAGAGVACLLPRQAWSQAAGANNDVRVAVVGLRTRGAQLVDAFRRLRGVRVAALCDCDTQFFAKELAKFADAKATPRTVVDFRRLLDAKDIDAVVIATPNHWHALMTVWACQAGKDVYVEKPVSHNISEGRKMVDAARKYRRIVQSGTQNRSDVGLKAALGFLRGGGLGKIKLARVFDYPRRQPIGKTDGPQPIPATADYNLFRGPAPMVPLRRKRLHYDWHFFWDTGSGDCGNRGVHSLDHTRWLIGQETLPTSVVSIAGRYAWDDDAETPNTQITLFDCKPVPILWELKSLPQKKGAKQMASFRGFRTSTLIECAGGYLTGGRGGATAWDWNKKPIKHFKGDSGRTHQANFISAVRSRKQTDLAADVLKGHVSSAMCHLANISYLVGYRRSAKEIAETVKDNKVLAESFDRLVGHLKANEIDLDKDRLTAGPTLTIDEKTERFTGEGAEWANMFVSRNYRRPFVVPQKV